VRVGVTLPTFRADAAVLDAARAAESAGLDGVFVFDHLWPIGAPHRPALSAFPVLGAVAAVTRRVWVGPLVARVGMVPDALLAAQLLSVARMAPGRFVAALGTGDSKSAPENVAFGLPYPAAAQRRAALATVARQVAAQGVPVWVGGGSAATEALAVALGAAVNLWQARPEQVAAAASRGEVTWGGALPADRAGATEQLAALAAAGASWAVCVWPASLAALAEARDALG